jgi:hypothetical protein
MQQLFENDRVKLWDLTIPPGETSTSYNHQTPCIRWQVGSGLAAHTRCSQPGRWTEQHGLQDLSQCRGNGTNRPGSTVFDRLIANLSAQIVELASINKQLTGGGPIHRIPDRHVAYFDGNSGSKSGTCWEVKNLGHQNFRQVLQRINLI